MQITYTNVTITTVIEAAVCSSVEAFVLALARLKYTIEVINEAAIGIIGKPDKNDPTIEEIRPFVSVLGDNTAL